MHTILRFLGTAAAVILTVHLVPGLAMTGSTPGTLALTTLLVALVWSVITMVIRPVLTILTLPITLLTFGLFSLILNAFLFWLMAALVPGFTVAGFWPALLGSIVLSVIAWFIHLVIPRATR